jgi:hypothetical protein
LVHTQEEPGSGYEKETTAEAVKKRRNPWGRRTWMMMRISVGKHQIVVILLDVPRARS